MTGWLIGFIFSNELQFAVNFSCILHVITTSQTYLLHQWYSCIHDTIKITYAQQLACVYMYIIYIYICICILCIYNKIYTKIKPNRYWKCFGYCLYQLIIKKSFFSYDIFYNELTSHNLHNLHQWTTKFLKRRYFINYLMEYLIHI